MCLECYDTGALQWVLIIFYRRRGVVDDETGAGGGGWIGSGLELKLIYFYRINGMGEEEAGAKEGRGCRSGGGVELERSGGRPDHTQHYLLYQLPTGLQQCSTRVSRPRNY